MRYIIISPVRNEERYIQETIYSVVAQTIRPIQWIIVNDGSQDKTQHIISQCLSEYPWIKLVNRVDRGFTQVGRGVIEAFSEGFKYISGEWDFIVKLDCDVLFDKHYFANLLQAFEFDQYLGIAGGTSFTYIRDRLTEEKMPVFHPWAGARMYKRACFEDINGLVEDLGWDTIDLLRAHMKGWRTKRFHDFKIIHLRRMSSRKGLWEGKVRTGRNFYITGYSLLFLCARCIYRLNERPLLVESVGVFWGYLSSMLRRNQLVVSVEEKNFLRKQQHRRLLGLKIDPVYE